MTFFVQQIEKMVQITIGNIYISVYDNIRPQLPLVLYIIESGTKGNKNASFNPMNTSNNTLINLQDNGLKV